MAPAHDHAHGLAAAVALRRAGNRRRMRTALAINLAMLAAAIAGALLQVDVQRR